jgi:hypothetical protein
MWSEFGLEKIALGCPIKDRWGGGIHFGSKQKSQNLPFFVRGWLPSWIDPVGLEWPDAVDLNNRRTPSPAKVPRLFGHESVTSGGHLSLWAR